MRSNCRIFVAIVLSTFMFFSILSAGITATTRTMTDQEFNKFKTCMGVYQPGKNYNIVINGNGTGLRPPTEEQWQKMRTMPIMVNIMNFSNTTIPTKYDNSTTKYFPPIGDQDGTNSCVAWATGYYTKTFQEALEHGWDLSRYMGRGILWSPNS